LTRSLFFIVFLSASTFLQAQNLQDIKIAGIQGSKPLIELLTDLEKQAPIKFFFVDEWLAPFSVDESFNGITLKEGLDRLLNGSIVTYYFMFDYAVVFNKDPKQAIERQLMLRKAAQSRKQIEHHSLGEVKDVKPGAQFVLSGTVTNRDTDSKMNGVVVRVNEKPVTTTDATGQYKLNLPAGNYVIGFQYENFVETVIDLSIYKDGVINVSLEDTPTMLEEVVISDQAIVNARMGQSTIRVKDLKRAPAFLGEVDLIKQLQTQAGVTSVGEVASGFNVRGGSVDQNLVVYDGTPIFNTSHALGFFTAFNAESIDKVNFYRGGIPAEFGGRVSSVLNLTSKDGPYDKWGGSAGIGIISSNLNFGGPIKKDTTSLFASFRASYSNWMLNSIQSNYKNLSNSSVSFYDGSLKFTHKFNAETKLSFSGYISHDNFSLANDTLYTWDNLALSIRLDKSFNSTLYSSVTVGVGQYGYVISEEDRGNAFDLTYQITYPSVKIDFTRSGSHSISFGLHNTYYNFAPGLLEPTTPESVTRRVQMDDENSLETALYVSDEFYLKQNLFVEAGLRLSMFNRIGRGKVYQYAPGAPLEVQNVKDSTLYGNNEVMKTYFGLEPRFALRYILTPNASIKFGYNRIFQYLHMITNTAAANPVDIWQSSNQYFKPQIGDQFSLGYYTNVRDNSIELFAEGFFKHVQNALDFKDGASLILNNKLETALARGVATSYGIEMSATKIKGRLLGSLNYTFSRSFRRINGDWPSEQINQGKIYPANYDQPHVVNLNWRYGFSRRHFFSANFTYHTGRPVSVPTSVYTTNGVLLADFSERNQYRIPDYHRLDLAFIIEGSHKRRKLFDGTWILSFYNAYGRKNVYSIFFQPTEDGKLQAYKLSVVGSVIPSISYSIKF
jgi:hypothetical protein